MTQPKFKVGDKVKYGDTDAVISEVFDGNRYSIRFIEEQRFDRFYEEFKIGGVTNVLGDVLFSRNILNE